MASSAALFRRWSALRSRAGAANRMITGGVTSSEVPGPWLLMTRCNNTGEWTWSFFCFAKNSFYYFLPDEHNRIRRPQILFGGFVEMVGSSHGWLASYDRKNRDLFLSDPVNCREINLPPPPLTEMPLTEMRGGEEEEQVQEEEEEEVHSVVLSDPGVAEGKAFTIFGSARSLAFCSPSRSRQWTPFGGGGYESVVYSTTHRRLLCLTSSLKLEAWDVEGEESPRLDWTARPDSSPAHREPEPEPTTKLNYIACEEETGQVYVVVRHVKPGAGRWVKVGVDRKERWVKVGVDRKVYVCPTVDFEVLKMEGGELMKMDGSLEGVTIFVGNNHPIAIRYGVGVDRDSIYFTYDKRVKPDRRDVGVFDYKLRGMRRHWMTYQINYDVSSPVWFTPRHPHR